MTARTLVEPSLKVEFAGEWFEPSPEVGFIIGREGDLAIDDNPYLHRRFLRMSFSGGFWWLHNEGARLSATVTHGDGLMQSWLAPGSGVPLVFPHLVLTFSAGSTTYEVDLYVAGASFHDRVEAPPVADGGQTLGAVPLTDSQRLVILALAERRLRRPGSGAVEIPSSAEAARRLGWTQTRFNRKLDNVCDKFSRSGVEGLRGGMASYAVNRRVRLVEYALTTLLVGAAQLSLLDAEAEANRRGGIGSREDVE